MKALSFEGLGLSQMTPAQQRRLLGLGAGLAVAVGAFAWQALAGTDAATEADVAPVTRAAPAAARATTADSIAGASAGASVAANAAAPRPVTVTTNVAAGARASTAPEPRDTVKVVRELFSYAPSGRRDPYRPLISTNALRPLPAELRLTAVAFDASGAQSVAILRDVTTQQQHRVRAGQVLGRMRILRIRPKAIVYAIEELGFSRTAELTLQDSTATRSQP